MTHFIRPPSLYEQAAVCAIQESLGAVKRCRGCGEMAPIEGFLNAAPLHSHYRFQPERQLCSLCRGQRHVDSARHARSFRHI